MKINQTSKGYCSDLAIARESAIITCILEETQWQAEEEEKSFIVEKRGSFGCALTKAVGMGKPQVG